jgi:hypothetical protein
MFVQPNRKLLFPRAGLLYHSKSFLFPQLDRLIVTATGKGLSIRTDGDTPNSAFMPCEAAQEVSGLQVPQLDGMIPTATGKDLTIRTHGDTPNDFFMPCESVDTMPGEIFRRDQRFWLYCLFLSHTRKVRWPTLSRQKNRLN